MKTKFQAVLTYLCLLAFSVLATIYLAWLFYPLEISFLHLESQVYMKSADISVNFTILMRYLTDPFVNELSMPNFHSSADGLHHFAQVKGLFHLTQFVFLATLPALYFFFKNVIQKGFGLIFRRFFIIMGFFPICLAFVALVVGFDSFFTLFHQVLFVGDNTWLFDPVSDPVIYILPQDFFLHCFILFFCLYEITCGVMVARTFLTKKEA